MEGAADRQRHDALHAQFFQFFNRRLHRVRFAADDNLFGGVDVCDNDAWAGGLDGLPHDSQFRHHGGHGAGAGLAGFVHGSAAFRDKGKTLAPSKNACGGQSAIFAKAMPGGGDGPDALGAQRGQRGHGDRVQRRLHVDRQFQFVFRPLEAKRGNGAAKLLVGLGKHIPGFGIRFGEFAAHADGLRALSGKQEGDIHSVGFP
ncbi:MAG: hypothetical protein BWZ10_01055 [candidate division BRC1 bacterium ADurb.BinA364]|nr:MAG: hypothetical protein BWZ10_01055 [candidate division BRC1 bacterium ADurb.BinA364]